MQRLGKKLSFKCPVPNKCPGHSSTWLKPGAYLNKGKKMKESSETALSDIFCVLYESRTESNTKKTPINSFITDFLSCIAF